MRALGRKTLVAGTQFDGFDGRAGWTGVAPKREFFFNEQRLADQPFDGLQSLRSSWSQSETAMPVAPPGPVRPMRWT